MAAINSLFFLLTTLAPYTEPPDPYTSSPEWNNGFLSQNGYNDVPSCIPDMPIEGEMRCPPNEFYQRCGPICADSCLKYDCPLNCCVEGCFCNEGYVRGPNGSCIVREECFAPSGVFELNRVYETDVQPSKECGPDEYIGCDSHCQRNCSNHHDVIMCPKICVLGCVCILPKIRGPDGHCIHPHQCPSLSETNREEMTGSQLICNFIRMMNPKDPRCPVTAKPCNDPDGCSDDENENYFPTTEGPQCSMPECDEDCTLDYSTKPCPSCNCDSAQNEIDDSTPCFPDAATEGHMDCPAREHYEECGTICMETCFEYDCPLKCCVENCFCDEGYVRGPNSTCIRKEQCSNHFLSSQNEVSNIPTPWRCRPGQILTCDSLCERTCSNYQDGNRKCPDTCVMGCVCIPPKVRGPDGSCIHPERCPAPSLTKLEEHMKKAAMICNFVRIMRNPPAWSDSCPMIVTQCSNPAGCYGNEESSSQLQGQFFSCRKNEFLNFKPSCPVTCQNYQIESKECKVIDMIVPRCDCKESLVRGPYGGCIHPQQCPDNGITAECPESEVWKSCGTACPKTCQNYDVDISCTEVCKKGCFCKEPRVRGPDGKCVLIKECPPKSTVTPVCPVNEYYDECKGHCQVDCTNYDKNMSCPKICVPSCVCIPPMVRGPDSSCIDVERCPAESPEESHRPCPQILCRDGWYLDTRIKPCPKCVECPLINCLRGCYLDRTYEPCPRCVCSKKMEGNDNLLPKPSSGNDDYDDNAVSEDEVPVTNNYRMGTVCPKNEYYTSCGTYCPKTCSNYGKVTLCPAVCVQGCFCKSPLVRGPHGDCIESRYCP